MFPLTPGTGGTTPLGPSSGSYSISASDGSGAAAPASALGGFGPGPGLPAAGVLALGLGPAALGTIAPPAAGLGAASIPALLAALTPGGNVSLFASTGRANAGAGQGTSDSGRSTTTAPPSQPNVIQRIEQVVPTGIWLALGGALAFAAGAGAWAMYSGYRVRRQARQFAAMSTAALTDPLTGVLNRRGFTEVAERELARAKRYGRPFVLAFVDVRGLKAVNDSEGHAAGDQLLTETARLLQDSARADDVVGRIGGDEMGLLLVEQNDQGAAAVRRRIDTEVRARRSTLGIGSPWDLTIGTASFPQDGDTVEDLLHAADLRLYEQRGISLR